MNPFIKLKQASQYSENDTYLLNINHIVRIQPGSGGGSRMITTTGEFYCDQRPNEVYEIISAALKES